MIRKLGEKEGKPLPISEASFPAPFDAGLEYAAPARGTWNIAHTGMLVPEAHEIFVCAQGCLRGVVLTAAEMGASERFSTVAVRENNVLDGDLENLLVEGVTDILEKLPSLPPAVLVYTSCVHHFMGTDLTLAYGELGRRFPSVRFTDCYMNPIMRKSGLTPDQLMRRQLYSLLDPKEHDPKTVLSVGGDFAVEEGDFTALLRENGFRHSEIQQAKTFSEYLELARAAFALTTQPAAIPAGKMLAEKHGMKHLHLPFSFDADEIEAQYEKLCAALGIPVPDWSQNRAECEAAMREAKRVIGDVPVVIDYTAFSRPLSLARLLLKHGFRVKRIYADSFTGEEKEDFEALKHEAPQLMIWPTVHPSMRVMPRDGDPRTLAVGQKAAYFTSSPHFVNVVENGGLWGFDAVIRTAELMTEAFLEEKDTRGLIGIKGWGCGLCQ
ncbi:MAG: nitrogenase [Clostridia bacterium]|nr:nitrogenase [Clostridia bacterium]